MLVDLSKQARKQASKEGRKEESKEVIRINIWRTHCTSSGFMQSMRWIQGGNYFAHWVLGEMEILLYSREVLLQLSFSLWLDFWTLLMCLTFVCSVRGVVCRSSEGGAFFSPLLFGCVVGGNQWRVCLILSLIFLRHLGLILKIWIVLLWAQNLSRSALLLLWCVLQLPTVLSTPSWHLLICRLDL
jgi:hypothetical protein